MSDQSKVLDNLFGGIDDNRAQFLENERAINEAEMNPFTRGVARGYQGLVSTAHGARAAYHEKFGDAVDRDAALLDYHSRDEKASTFTKETSLTGGDGTASAWDSPGTFIAETFGEALPSLAESFITAAAATQITPGIDPTDVALAPVGFVAKGAVKGYFKQLAAKYAKRTIVKELGEEATKQLIVRNGRNWLANQGMKQFAKKGVQIAAITGVTGMHEAGGMYAELAARGIHAPGSAMTLGLASGLSESFLGATPKMLSLFKVTGGALKKEAKKGGIRAASGLLWDMAKSANEEGIQEGFQELISMINMDMNDPDHKWDKESFKQFMEAYAGGFVVGGVTGGAGSIKRGVGSIKSNIQNYRKEKLKDAPVDLMTGQPIDDAPTQLSEESQQAAQEVADILSGKKNEVDDLIPGLEEPATPATAPYEDGYWDDTQPGFSSTRQLVDGEWITPDNRQSELESMSRQEVYQLAQDMEIDIRGKTKSKVIKAIIKNEQPQQYTPPIDVESDESPMSQMEMFEFLGAEPVQEESTDFERKIKPSAKYDNDFYREETARPEFTEEEYAEQEKAYAEQVAGPADKRQISIKYKKQGARIDKALKGFDKEADRTGAMNDTDFRKRNAAIISELEDAIAKNQAGRVIEKVNRLKKKMRNFGSKQKKKKVRDVTRASEAAMPRAAEDARAIVGEKAEPTQVTSEPDKAIDVLDDNKTAEKKLTYDEFKSEMERLLKESGKYTIDQVGSREFTKQMADLADKYPEFDRQMENETPQKPAEAKAPAETRDSTKAAMDSLREALTGGPKVTETEAEYQSRKRKESSETATEVTEPAPEPAPAPKAKAPTKAELLKEAKAKGLDVKASMKKADIETVLTEAERKPKAKKLTEEQKREEAEFLEDLDKKLGRKTVADIEIDRLDKKLESKKKAKKKPQPKESTPATPATPATPIEEAQPDKPVSPDAKAMTAIVNATQQDIDNKVDEKAPEKAPEKEQSQVPEKAPKKEQSQVPEIINSIESYNDFMKRFDAGNVTADELRAAFKSFTESRQAFVDALSKKTKAEIARAAQIYRNDMKKPDLIQSAIDRFAREFVPQAPSNGMVSFSMTIGESTNDAVNRQIKNITDEQIKDIAQKTQEDRKKQEESREQTLQAMKDPQTLSDFSTADRYGVKFTEEQLSRYDDLRAKDRRERAQKRKKEQQARLTESVGDLGMSIVEAYHDKKGIPMFVVQQEKRVERDEFNHLKSLAKQHDGYYSRFRGGRAKPGFQFTSQEDAQAFIDAATEGEATPTVEPVKEKTGAEKLKSMADGIMERAIAKRDQDRRTNTARQAGMAASSVADAESDIAIAKTMQNIAKTIESGKAEHLKKLKDKTQIETIMNAMSRAKREYVLDNNINTVSNEYKELPIWSPAYMKHVKYPEYELHRDSMVTIANELSKVTGAKRAEQYLRKLAKQTNENRHVFTSARDLDIIDIIKKKLKGESLLWIIEHDSANIGRLNRLDVLTLPELRAAIREYTTLKEDAKSMDPVTKLELEIKGDRFDGLDFFPTPIPLATRMVEMADIEPGMSVLEPSAGKGDIAQAVKDKYPKADVTTVEVSSKLRDIIKARGLKLADDYDFLQHEGEYDRIIMNPPFSNNKDVQHVRHAFSLLKPGGKIIAIVSEHPFFASDKVSKDFREWFDEVGISDEPMQGAFNGKDAFRKTGVNTRLIEIEKPAGKNRTEEAREGTPADKPLNKADKQRVRVLAKKILGNAVPVEFVDRITTPEGRNALGNYSNALIKLANGDFEIDDTLMHEAVHATLDLFVTPAERQTLIDAAGGEENLAEGIVKYAKDRTGFTGRARRIVNKFLRLIKKLFTPVESDRAKVDRFYELVLGGAFAQESVQDTQNNDIKYRLEELRKDPETFIDGIRNHAMDWLDSFKNPVEIDGKRQDLTKFDRLVRTPMHAFAKIPQLKRMFEVAVGFGDDKHKYGEMILGENEVRAKQIAEFAKTPEFEKFNDRMYEKDRNAIGYRVNEVNGEFQIQAPPVKLATHPTESEAKSMASIPGSWHQRNDQGTWDVYKPGQVLQTFQNEDTAWETAYTKEGADFKKEGFSDQAVQALLNYRLITHEGHRQLRYTIDEITKILESNGAAWSDLDLPSFSQDGTITDLFQMLKVMGDRRGYYMPRLRDGGGFLVFSYKDGANPMMETFVTEKAAQKHVKTMTREGYRSEIKVSNTPSEQAFVDTDVVAMNDLIQNSLEAMKKSNKDAQLGDFGIKGEFIDYETKDGKTEKHFVFSQPQGTWAKVVFKRLGAGRYKVGQDADKFSANDQVWHVKTEDKDFPQKIAQALHLHQYGVIKPVSALAESFTKQVATMIHARGSRSAKIGRSDRTGIDVFEGYEKDSKKAIIRSAKSIAGGTAKRTMAKKMQQIMTGTEKSWNDFAKENAEKGMTNPELYQAYQEMVQEQRIDSATQKESFGAATVFMKDMLRNTQPIERYFDKVRGAMSVWFLSGFGSGFVNMTAQLTNVPAVFQHDAGMNPIKTVKTLVQATPKYVGFLKHLHNPEKHPNKLKGDDAWVFQEIRSLGMDSDLLNTEAMNALRDSKQNFLAKGAEALLWPFGVTEKINRATTIYTAYQHLKKGPKDEAALQKAREMSDRAHGSYGKPNLWEWARGEDLKGILARSFAAYKTFSANYLDVLMQMGYASFFGDNKAQARKAATWMLLAPAVVAGGGASLAATGLSLLAKAIGIDEPEEQVYRGIEDTLGNYAGQVARGGVAGAAGLNIKGSLSIGITDLPTDLESILGAPYGFAKQIYEGGENIMRGNFTKGTEKLLPRAFAQPIKAIREGTEGVTSKYNQPIYYGDEQIKLDWYQMLIRATLVAPADPAYKREKIWKDKVVARKYQEIRTGIYEKMRRHILNGGSMTDWGHILIDIKEYNADIADSRFIGLTPIKPAQIKNLLKKMSRPEKRERLRTALKDQK